MVAVLRRFSRWNHPVSFEAIDLLNELGEKL
jgi:hypothetical protein